MSTSYRDEPKVNTCVYMGQDVAYCFPINQPGKKEFERKMKPGSDLVISYEDYAEKETSQIYSRAMQVNGFLTTRDAVAASEETNKQLNIVLEIDGVSTIYSATAVKDVLKIGDPRFVIGDPDIFIGGLVEITDQETLISYDAGTTTTISQTIKQDTGEGTTVSRYQIALVDEDGKISELITPGAVVEDMLGRKVKIWLGYAETEFKKDYIIIHRGFIRNIQSKAGVVLFDIAHPDLKKKSDIFVTAETALDGAIDDSTTGPIDVDDTTNFLEKIVGPDGVTIDPDLTTFLKIDDEVIEYQTKSAGQFSTLTRGALGTTAAAHDDDATVSSLYRIGPTDAMSIALKILLSGKEGPYLEDLEASNFLRTDPSTITANAILFKDINIIQEYNIRVGDFVTTTGASNGANNVSDAAIVSITESSLGYYIVLDDSVSLVEEIATSALVSFRSKYDVWPSGAGIALDNELVDIAEHEKVQRQFLSSFEYDFRLTDTINAKEFLQGQVYNPASAYELPRKAQASVGVQTPPLPGSNIKTISNDNVLNAKSLVIQRSITEQFFNTIIYKFEKALLEDEFARGEVFVSADSVQRIPNAGNKSLTIESQGMREVLSAKNLADQASTRRLNKYKYGAEFVKGTQVNLETGWDVEVGDASVLDIASLQMTDSVSGQRGAGDSRIFDIINKKLNTKTGVVTLDVVDSNADKDNRYGLISPCSQIKVGNSTTSWVINPTFNTDRFGNDEWRKWINLVGASIIVRSVDYSVTGTGVISAIVGNTITVESSIGFVPPAGYVMELDVYSNQPDSVKLLFAFQTDDDNDFADGGAPYVIS